MRRNRAAPESLAARTLALNIRPAYAGVHVYRGIVDGCGAATTHLARRR